MAVSLNVIGAYDAYQVNSTQQYSDVKSDDTKAREANTQSIENGTGSKSETEVGGDILTVSASGQAESMRMLSDGEEGGSGSAPASYQGPLPQNGRDKAAEGELGTVVLKSDAEDLIREQMLEKVREQEENLSTYSETELKNKYLSGDISSAEYNTELNKREALEGDEDEDEEDIAGTPRAVLKENEEKAEKAAEEKKASEEKKTKDEKKADMTPDVATLTKIVIAEPAETLDLPYKDDPSKITFSVTE